MCLAADVPQSVKKISSLFELIRGVRGLRRIRQSTYSDDFTAGVADDQEFFGGQF
jgi:hypothetical protein